MADYGFRISKTGSDVKTCDDKDCVLTSKYSTLKGSLEGSGSSTVTENGSARVITIAHGLGYIPMVQAYFKDTDGVYLDAYYYLTPFQYFDGTILVITSAYADTTNVYLEFAIENFGGGSDTIDVDYQYYIFIDKGKL